MIDYAIAPALVAWTIAATAFLLRLIPAPFVSTIVVLPVVVATAILERRRPEHAAHKPFDLPAHHDILVAPEKGIRRAMADGLLVLPVGEIEE